jgi:MFS family permease
MDQPSAEPKGWQRIFSGGRLLRVLRYPDFRLLWIGAFLSFTGSWVQNVAQGYYVYNLTHDESKLAFVNFSWSLPVLVFGLVAGSFSDHFNKRAVLIWTQIVFTLTTGFLAAAVHFGFIQYWQFVMVSFINGLVSCIEMPTRQSIVSRVVPIEELSAAVPVNAMTFNVARIFGPAIGGIVLAAFGAAYCFLLNSISYLALVWSGWAIKSDLKPTETRSGPLIDLVLEGARYTFYDVRLRTLFLLEALTACFGLAYLPLVPAYVQDVLRMPDPRQGNGFAFTAVGVGAFVGLVVVAQLSDAPYKAAIIRFSMWTICVGLLLLSVLRNLVLVFPILSAMGMAAVMQLNTTNALFQILAPDRLRGRVLAMHIWAINGLSPFGVLLFGWLAKQTKNGGGSLFGGVPLAFEVGAAIMAVGGIAAILSRRGLAGLEVDPSQIDFAGGPVGAILPGPDGDPARERS